MSAQRDDFGARATLATDGGSVGYYRLAALAQRGIADLGRLPITVKILLENVLRNAVDAVRQKGERGSVRVELRDTPLPTVTITDNGVGFDPAETQKLFLPFHSNKPNGFGMGLPLAKKIVLLHGGTLRLQGEPGKGAVATIEFADVIPSREDGDGSGGRGDSPPDSSRSAALGMT